MSIRNIVNLVNTTMPYAWDDSLSVYEMLGKLVSKLNEVVAEVNLKLPDNFEVAFYEKFREYTKEEMQRILDSGEFAGVLDSMIANVAEVKSQLSEIANADGIAVESYGAVGDNNFHTIGSIFPDVTLSDLQSLHPDATVNSSADWYAIQTAINNESKPIKLYKKYVIDLPIRILKNDVTLIGLKSFSSVRTISQTHNALVLGEPDKPIVYRANIRDIVFTGGGSGKPHNLSSGLRLGSVTQSEISGCEFKRFSAYGLVSYDGDNAYSIRFNECYFDFNNMGGGSIRHTISGQKTAMKFSGCRFGNNGYSNDSPYLFANKVTTTFGDGMHISGVGFLFDATTFEGNSGCGLKLGGDTTTDFIIGITVTACYFEPNLLGNLVIDLTRTDGLNVSVKGNYFHNIASAYPGANMEGTYLPTNIHFINKQNLTHYETDDVYISDVIPLTEELGGRNFIEGSAFHNNDRNIEKYNVGIEVVEVLSPYGDVRKALKVTPTNPSGHYLRFTKGIPKKGFFTFSYWIKTDSLTGLIVQTNVNDGNIKNNQIKNEWVKGVQNNIDITSTESFVSFRIVNSVEPFYIFEPQLEKGRLMTDWKISPYDALENITI